MTEIAELEALVLEWAERRHPEKHAQTIAMREKPETYQRFLLRLIEIRVGEEPEWFRRVPTRILAETKIVAQLRDRETGRMLTFAGARAKNPQAHRFIELDMLPSDFELLLSAWDMLDLEYIVEEQK
jgi:hypothetical protein